jgi:hypothetical protein
MGTHTSLSRLHIRLLELPDEGQELSDTQLQVDNWRYPAPGKLATCIIIGLFFNRDESEPGIRVTSSSDHVII